MLRSPILLLLLVLAPAAAWIALDLRHDGELIPAREPSRIGAAPPRIAPAGEPDVAIVPEPRSRTALRDAAGPAEPDVHAEDSVAEAHSGTVLGSVRTREGDPVVDLGVRLAPRGAASEPPHSTRTDAAGCFELEDVEPGAHRLWLEGTQEARMPGPAPRPLPVTVAPGQRALVGELVCGGGPASLAGRVLDRDGSALGGVHVVYDEPEGGSWAWSVVTDARGRYAVDGLDPGPARVELEPLIFPDGELGARRSVWLGSGVRLELPDQRLVAPAADIARRRADLQGLICVD